MDRLTVDEAKGIKVNFLKPSDQVTVVGEIFHTPFVVKGLTWIPLIEIVAAGILTWVSGRRHPNWSLRKKITTGCMAAPIVVGSEWGHNLAHAAAADLIGKPMDAARITWGTPLLVYYDIEDSAVTPKEHIIRASGGPVFNACLVPILALLRRIQKPNSVAHEITDFALTANVFLCTAALLPIPGIDGGPILKWSLVGRGHTPRDADQIVKKVNGVLGFLLGLLGIQAFKNRRWFLGALLIQFASIALGVALGWLREK
jgi:Zn-dependent protease